MADAETSTTPTAEALEALQARHRKEQRDLVARTTQKKKQASKKTRKGVNDECARLESELQERQEQELAALNGDTAQGGESDADADGDAEPTAGLEKDAAKLSLDSIAATTPPPLAGSTEMPVAANGDTGPKQKKAHRGKARLARRAAEQSALVAAAELEAASAPNPREIERERMAAQLERHGLALHEIRADGHCMYAAVADQLGTREINPTLTPRIRVAVVEDGNEEGVQGYKKVRMAAADWIQSHADDFVGFVEDALPEHVRKIRETGEWGGHVELLALARTYGVRICVLHSDGQVDKVEPEEGVDAGKKEIWLGYYRHSHGLGEHYNSLRKKG